MIRHNKLLKISNLNLKLNTPFIKYTKAPELTEAFLSGLVVNY
tara:strand:- start:901 stop:1029 length:129 start_codon:yes stop_codon:yes gene_type:complete